jgi:hypothetical protein
VEQKRHRKGHEQLKIHSCKIHDDPCLSVQAPRRGHIGVEYGKYEIEPQAYFPVRTVEVLAGRQVTELVEQDGKKGPKIPDQVDGRGEGREEPCSRPGKQLQVDETVAKSGSPQEGKRAERMEEKTQVSG